MEQVFASSGLIAIMLCSLVYCFYGYRFFKMLLGLSGALILGSLTWMAFSRFAPHLMTAAIISSLILAALGAWLFHKAFKLAAFLYGSAAGATFSPVILTYISSKEQWITWLVPILCGLVGGLLLLISRRLVMIVMTSASGAVYFTMALFLLLIQHSIFEKTVLESPNNYHASMWLISFILCFCSGLLCQFRDKSTQK
jgi:hypothetical protein